MSQNTNLFYNLYSKSNNIQNAGYVCQSAIDEEDTSFDIANDTGTITNSNGDTLAAIDLAQIHAAGLTQYTTETKILQPHSCCLLQGQEYGLSRASYYFIIPAALSVVEGYEKYVSCDFDITYNNFAPCRFHVSAVADGENSFSDLVNDSLSENNITISVSIQELEDPSTKETQEYFVFLAENEGYFYYINNIKLTPAFQSDEYPYSPFSKALSGMKTIIYDFIEQYHPIKLGEIYEEETYEVDCNLYKWTLYNYQDAVNNLNKFKQAITILKEIEAGQRPISDIELVNELIKYTAYDADIISEYDTTNMELIANIIESIKAFIIETENYYQDVYWLDEDPKRRITIMKYPNGAFRGIVLIPEWPTNYSEEYANAALLINHIKPTVTLYEITPEKQYMPKKYGVLSNATLFKESCCCKRIDPSLGTAIQCNCNCIHEITDGWSDTLQNDYVEPFLPDKSIYDDLIYMGQNCYAKKDEIIGLFRYMQYVNDNDLWNKVGQAYMIVGNEDNPQTHIKNLPTSLIIYNPNDVQIRIKYMIFS